MPKVNDSRKMYWVLRIICLRIFFLFGLLMYLKCFDQAFKKTQNKYKEQMREAAYLCNLYIVLFVKKCLIDLEALGLYLPTSCVVVQLQPWGTAYHLRVTKSEIILKVHFSQKMPIFFVKSPNIRTYYFPELENLNFGDWKLLRNWECLEN